jgi:hypothetical protein
MDGFRYVKVYKDGNPFGRCLIISDFPSKGLAIVYNTYPGHSEGKYEKLFTDAFLNMVKQHTGVELKSLQVPIENRTPDSWFYANNKRGILVSESMEELNKVGKVVFDFGNRPDITLLPEYECGCIQCKNRYIFTYDPATRFNGLKQVAGICPRCSSCTVTCTSCKKEYIAVTGSAFNSYNDERIAGPVASRTDRDGGVHHMCNGCWEKSRGKYKIID